MLTIYRRHRAKCKHKSRRYKGCFCPIWVQGVLRGETIRKSVDLTNWEAAQSLVRDWEVDGPRERVFLFTALKRFIEDVESRGLSAEWVGKLKHMRSEMEAHFGDVQIASISVDDLAKFRESWKVNATTSRKKLERVRSFFKFCVGRKWLETNPARELRQPKESLIEKKPFEKDELKKIAEAVPRFPAKGIYGEANRERIEAFLATLRWTGLRIRDVVCLRKSAVRDGMITVRAHKNQKPIKLPVHKDMAAGLKSLKYAGDYFFWSGLGNPKSCVADWQRTLIRLSEVAGVHIHAHRFRHTFATDLLSKGVPVSEVAAILGNSPRIIEKHYSHWIQARQDAIDKAVRRAWA